MGRKPTTLNNMTNAILESAQTSNGTVVWAYRSTTTGKLLSGWRVTVAAAKAAARTAQ